MGGSGSGYPYGTRLIFFCWPKWSLSRPKKGGCGFLLRQNALKSVAPSGSGSATRKFMRGGGGDRAQKRSDYLFKVASPLGVDALAVVAAELSVSVAGCRRTVQLV